VTKTRQRAKVRDDYLALVKGFPLRPIRNGRDHAEALVVLRKLAVRRDEDLSDGELDYVEGLTRFVEDYEQAHHRIDLSRLKPLDVLKHLMEESGMEPADLARLLGSQPIASLVLAGKRELSKAHIRKLAARFHVDVGLFL